MNSNAITQLEQWKANNQAQANQAGGITALPVVNLNKGITQTKSKLLAKRPKTEYGFMMAQLIRQFELANSATAFCKLNYPASFHHKQKLAKECDQLRADLKAGKHLLMAFIEQYKPPLNAEQRQALRAFKGAIQFLNEQLKGTARYVELIDSTCPEDIAELVKRKDGNTAEENNQSETGTAKE